ncbi:MAG: hypothetical protein II838_14385 [Lachnospiraceae bacterium]|nr:hypothetical protein [Lachnospiraceae bacterium]
MLSYKEKDYIKQLEEMRFLENGMEEIEKFEEICYKLQDSDNVELVSELCKIPEDKCFTPSSTRILIQTIIKIIEKNDIKIGLCELVKGTSNMLDKGIGWAKKLHGHFISGEYLNIYIEVVRDADVKDRENVIKVLYEIGKLKWNTIDIEKIVNLILE